MIVAEKYSIADAILFGVYCITSPKTRNNLAEDQVCAAEEWAISSPPWTNLPSSMPQEVCTRNLSVLTIALYKNFPRKSFETMFVRHPNSERGRCRENRLTEIKKQFSHNYYFHTNTYLDWFDRTSEFRQTTFYSSAWKGLTQTSHFFQTVAVPGHYDRKHLIEKTDFLSKCSRIYSWTFFLNFLNNS